MATRSGVFAAVFDGLVGLGEEGFQLAASSLRPAGAVRDDGDVVALVGEKGANAFQPEFFSE